MHDDGYRVLFDASDHFPALWFALPGFVFIAITRAIWRNRASSSGWQWPLDTRPRLRALSAGYMLAFSVLWTSVAAIGIAWQHMSARRLLSSGEATVVEGVISNFSSDPKTERFEVGGVRFKYSPYLVTAGYRELGGPFGNGSQMRIHYAPGDAPLILKLELRDQVVCR